MLEELRVEIQGRHIRIRASEIDDAACPSKPKWAASQIEQFGLALAQQIPRLAPFTRCPTVLELAGFTVEVIPDPPESDSSSVATIPDTPEPEPTAEA